MTDTKEQEIWKPYPEFPFVEANQFGKIRTKDRWVTVKGQSKRLVKGRVLKPQDIGHGYVQVHFRVDGKHVYLYVHRIVATCFIPNPNNYPEVNHIDNDPTNNAVNNLEWCTHCYNMSYKEKYGISSAEALGRPVFAVNLKTGKVIRLETRSEAARKLGVSQGNIYSVIKGKLYQIGGYWFTEYESEITEEKIREIKAKMKFRPVISANPETYEVFLFKTQSEAARQLGVDVSNVTKVVKGKLHKTGGCWFTYADENAVEITRAKFGDKIAKKVKELIRKRENYGN